ncbi:MAG: transglycosylase domain-containing protein [Acidimicrobiia bacterium]
MLRQLIRAIAIMVTTSAAIPLAVGGTVMGSFLFLPLPATLPETNPIEGGQITKIVTVKGEEIGQLREFEQNIPFRPEDVPLILKQAVISAEDQNFYTHKGVDFRGTARALVADIRGDGVLQGGSTITQQYVKHAYTDKERTLIRKVREAILSSQLERTHKFSKDDILYKYLSIISLGNGAYGVAAASETYFRKPVSQLNVSEAALLAGLIPAPSRYEPRGNPQLAEEKRQIVLRKMFEQGFIDQATYDVMKQYTVFLVTSQTPQPPPGIPATLVYPPQETPTRYPYFTDYVKRYLLQRYPDELIFKGGLTVITTIDPELQAAAERARDQAIDGIKPANCPDCPGTIKQTPLEMSIVAVEPPTGYVKALVGGQDFSAAGGQVNLALGGCAPNRAPFVREPITVAAECWSEDSNFIGGGGIGRQAGSSWKPFILAAGFAKGFAPNKVYSGQGPYTFPGGKIENFGGSSYGSLTLRSATHQSVNTAYARLLKDVGMKDAGEMAKKLGIRSTYIDADKGLSYTLGVDPASPLEMASAYGVFANSGKRAEPTPVLQVRCGSPVPNTPCDQGGKILEDNTKPKTEQVIEAAVADNVTDVLKGVITGGTGTRANIGRPAAGKTGTAQGSKDSWFVGYTPTLSTAVWIGYRDKEIPMIGIRGCGRGMTGGCLPAMTWKNFMTAALEDVPATDFNEPAPIKHLADELKRQKRSGIDPGTKRNVTATEPGGPYVVGPPQPKATAPTPTTTTTIDAEDDESGGPDPDDPGGGPGLPDPTEG